MLVLLRGIMMRGLWMLAYSGSGRRCSGIGAVAIAGGVDRGSVGRCCGSGTVMIDTGVAVVGIQG